MVLVQLLVILLRRLFRWLVSQWQNKALVRCHVHRVPDIHLTENLLGVVNALSSAFNTNPVSGIMGLAWSPLSSTRQTPFWQTLASGGSWDSALFGVQLTRYVETD